MGGGRLDSGEDWLHGGALLRRVRWPIPRLFEESKLNHDASTNALIERYRRLRG
jgi:hypothetical protein